MPPPQPAAASAQPTCRPTFPIQSPLAALQYSLLVSHPSSADSDAAASASPAQVRTGVPLAGGGGAGNVAQAQMVAPTTVALAAPTGGAARAAAMLAPAAAATAADTLGFTTGGMAGQEHATVLKLILQGPYVVSFSCFQLRLQVALKTWKTSGRTSRLAVSSGNSWQQVLSQIQPPALLCSWCRAGPCLSRLGL